MPPENFSQAASLNENPANSMGPKAPNRFQRTPGDATTKRCSKQACGNL